MLALGLKNSVGSELSVELLLPYSHLALRPGFRASPDKSNCLQGSLASRSSHTPPTFPYPQAKSGLRPKVPNLVRRTL